MTIQGNNSSLQCKVCGSDTVTLDDSQHKITYSVCNHCEFIYKDIQYHISPEQEHTEYKKHNNSFESLGYVKMFERFIDEHIKPLNINGVGLEYGSGPGPVLKELLSREGITMFDYDPFFNPNTDYKTRKYELITSTEVAEHFTNPIEEFEHIASLLKKDGYLAIMTSFHYNNPDTFLKWWYRRDFTHIAFYTPKTFEIIAEKCNLKIVKHNDKNVIIFQK